MGTMNNDMMWTIKINTDMSVTMAHHGMGHSRLESIKFANIRTMYAYIYVSVHGLETMYTDLGTMYTDIRVPMLFLKIDLRPF